MKATINYGNYEEHRWIKEIGLVFTLNQLKGSSE